MLIESSRQTKKKSRNQVRKQLAFPSVSGHWKSQVSDPRKISSILTLISFSLMCNRRRNIMMMNHRPSGFCLIPVYKRNILSLSLSIWNANQTRRRSVNARKISNEFIHNKKKERKERKWKVNYSIEQQEEEEKLNEIFKSTHGNNEQEETLFNTKINHKTRTKITGKRERRRRRRIGFAWKESEKEAI